MKIWNPIKNCLRRVDRYGVRMAFTYNGSRIYTTVYGGILSFLICIIILGYAYLLLTTPEKFQVTTNLLSNSYSSTQTTVGSSNSTSSNSTSNSNVTNNKLKFLLFIAFI